MRPKTSVGAFAKSLIFGDEIVNEQLFDLANQDVVGQKFVALNDPDTYGVTVRYGF